MTSNAPRPGPDPISSNGAPGPTSASSSLNSATNISIFSTTTLNEDLDIPTAEASFPAEILGAEPSTFTKGGIPLSTEDYVAASADRSGSESVKFPRISRPVPMMRTEYDVVVVGSGYGGGVAASRMARGGQHVCVLELGKEKWPGEYPVSTADAVSEVHVSGNLGKDGGNVIDSNVGSPTGLYHLILGEGQNAFVANGLGGTSLLNANIFLEADARTLQLDYWPEEISSDPSCLDKYYKRAANVLQPTPYPEDFPKLDKLSLLEKQAQLMGVPEKFSRAPQTTFFTNGLNSTGVEMKASTLSGQDCTGVNDGSKNSVLMNYLPDAWNWGAEIFCECEVRHVKRDSSGKGWIVFFAWHGDNRAKYRNAFYKELMWVKARKLVFLGAGALGTTEILLRSRDHGLKMSNKVGRGMSGNGDILSFGYNTDEIANAIGREHVPADRPVGPTINGVIDMRDQPNVLDGYVLEEGAVPEALAPVLQAMLEAMPDKIYPKGYNIKNRLRHLLSRTETRIKGPYAPTGSISRTQMFLIMSHDNNEATLTLEKGKPYLRFLGVGRTEHVKELNEVLANATSKLGGTLINSPFYSLCGQEEITVHPIGGAIMSSDGTGEGGATNHIGEVFSGEGSEIHEGLICVDGSVIPCALGVNPFATITALAERSVEEIAKKNGIVIDYKTKNGEFTFYELGNNNVDDWGVTKGRLDLLGKPRRSIPLTPDMKKTQQAIAEAASQSGTRFSEIMEGHMYIGDDIDDFYVAANSANGSSSAARFLLSVDSYSTKNLIQLSDHAAIPTGTFSCGALSKDPFMVLRGAVQFFTQDESSPDTKNLAYRFDLIGTDGQLLHFDGYKIIDSNMAFSISTVWKATTVLYVTLTRPDGTKVGRGILKVTWRNFMTEMLGFGVSGPTIMGKLGAATQFVNYFTGKTLGYFFFPLRMLQYPTLSAVGYYPKTPPAEVVTLTAVDGVKTVMHVWSSGGNPGGLVDGVENGARTSGVGASRKPPLLFVPGAAVDQQMYALPTIPNDSVTYFLAQGYTIYIPTHRIGRTKIAENGYTAFDARLDIKAALEYIRKDNPVQVYCVVHCAGAISMASGLLDGTIPSGWIKGITASQVFANPKWPSVNAVKARLPLPSVYKAVAGSWFSCLSSPDDYLVQRFMDQILRFYPVGNKSEMCNSTVCHRSELAFGRLWTHKQLNSATHSNLSNFLGGVSMNALTHLMSMGNSGYAMDNDGASLISPRNLARLKGIPILFISGGLNAVYTPESTDTSYNLLRDNFGPDNYQRIVFQDRGHLDCWMGKTAYRDVYPQVLDHIEDITNTQKPKY